MRPGVSSSASGWPLTSSFSGTTAASAVLRKANWAIDKVTADMEGRFAFNTAIAAVMELVNDIYRLREGAGPGAVRFATATAASLIFPFAPHLGAEVWQRLTGGRVWEEPWPQADPEMLASDTISRARYRPGPESG